MAEAIRETKRRGGIPVIAEIKRRIPKLAESGRPPDARDAAALARAYQSGGACGISLVTETEHFGGQPGVDVPAVLRATPLPVLIKDFNRDKARIDYYADLVGQCGANCLARVTLLLTAHWLGTRLPAFLDYVHRRGMLALVETRQPADLDALAGFTLPQLVGINNKDIDELERGDDRLRFTPELAAVYRQRLNGGLLISQSAHHSPADVRRSSRAGADAVLVGTAFMTAARPAETVACFTHAGEAVR